MTHSKSGQVCLRLIASSVLSVAACSTAFAMDFQGDQRLTDVASNLHSAELYPSDHGGGKWFCEVQLEYRWNRDMSKSVVIAPDNGWYQEDWVSGADNSLTFRFNEARGERVNDQYTFYVSLASYDKFSVGQRFVFTPKTGNTSTTIVATLTRGDIMDGADFQTHCVQ